MVTVNNKQRWVDFGEFIRDGRMRGGLYQRELADKVGITQSHISLIEKGERGADLFLAMKICEVLGLDLTEYVKKYI